MYDLEHYRSQFGDPLSNGLGHKVTTLPGESKASVIIPSAPVRKIKRRTRLAAEMTTHIAEGEQAEFGEEASLKVQNDLFSGFDLSRGIGASLDSILGRTPAPRVSLDAAGATRSLQDSSGKKTPSKPESPQQGSLGECGLLAFNLAPCNLAQSFASAAAAPETPTPEPSKHPEKPSGKKRKAPLANADGTASGRPPCQSGKKGRPGMDLVAVTKSHVEVRPREEKEHLAKRDI